MNPTLSPLLRTAPLVPQCLHVLDGSTSPSVCFVNTDTCASLPLYSTLKGHLRVEDPGRWQDWAVAGSAPRPSVTNPQEGLHTLLWASQSTEVTHCEEEEDTSSGSGPGWAAPVSCLALVPLGRCSPRESRVKLSRATKAL